MLTCESSCGWTTASIHTSPVNQSAGPFTVGCFGRMFMSSLLVVACAQRQAAAPVPRLGAKQRLDGAALVHGAIPLGNLGEWKCEVEDPAGVDLAVPNEVGELREEAPDRRRPSVKMGVAEEKFVPGQLAVRDADVADMPTGASGVDCLHHRLSRSDCLDDRVGSESVGEFPDPGGALIAAFFDDVGRTELEGQPLS